MIKMQAIQVNLCVKEPKSFLNYHLSSFKVDSIVNFPNQILEEVRNLSKKEKREYSKIAKSFLMTSMSFLTLSSKSMANTLNAPQTQQTIVSGIPTDFISPIMELIGMAIGASLALSVILLIAAGIMRQFRKKKESIEWSNDIIRGFLQILVATPVIFLLYYLTTLLLGNFTEFLKPF